MQYWIIVNVHWIPTFELPVVVMKGLAYLLTYFIAVVIDSKLNDWINFGIYWKTLLSHSRPWPWPRVCGLGLGLLALLTSPHLALLMIIMTTNMNTESWFYLVVYLFTYCEWRALYQILQLAGICAVRGSVITSRPVQALARTWRISGLAVYQLPLPSTGALLHQDASVGYLQCVSVVMCNAAHGVRA